jgi:hypothetical protein
VGLVRRVARARLAGQVVRRLRRGGTGDVRYDAGTFSVRFTPAGEDTPVVVPLDALLRSRARRRRARRAQVARFVAGIVAAPGVPPGWDQACPLLRPVLRGTTMPPAGVSAPLRRPALPFLAEFAVVDQPDTMTYVAAEQLASWAVTADEVFAAARSNLSGATLKSAAREPTVLHFVDDGDAYWTSHLLLDGWLAGLAEQVGGAPVAFAPERGALIVAADGSAHLPALFAEAEEAYTASARPITPMAYVSDARGRTVPYRAEPGHPLYHCVRRASAVLAVREYGRQARALPGAAELVLVGSERDGWRTRALWPKDGPVLLPRADEVLVGDAVRPWPVAGGDPEPGLDPPRWRLAAWPTP